MKYLIYVAACLTLTACGSTPVPTISGVGKDAQPCTVTKQSNGALISCPDGSQASVVDGTAATMVQFCSGEALRYPSSFPEYGICIANKLYGVYWDGHNSWLTALPAGTYMSTATGLQCNFTITNACSIQ